MIVVDNSLIVGFSTQSETTALAKAVRSQDPDWLALQLWESELRNVMLKLIRAGVIGYATAMEACQVAQAAAQTFPVSTPATLRIAEAHGLTAHDAEFAALAEWLEVPCVSFDSDLKKTGLAMHPQDYCRGTIQTRAKAGCYCQLELCPCHQTTLRPVD